MKTPQIPWFLKRFWIVVALLLLIGYAVTRVTPPGSDAAKSTSTRSARASALSTTFGSGSAQSSGASTGASTGSSGLPTCRLADLPSQARDTADAIRSGGPYRYPRNDGVTFGNREGVLPKQQRGYYREYTVVTPGASTRGTRRIITGGDPKTAPPQWFYTGDHYATFCEITDAR